MAKLKEGDECQVKGNSYMWCRIKRILPNGSHGRKCVLAECECVANYSRGDYTFGLIKTFRLVDLKAPNS